MRKRLIDLFCGAGGAAVGYVEAGFEVVGVDITAQPNYPYSFICAHALQYPLAGFDVIHASPPCQHYSVASTPQRSHGYDYPDLVAATQERLITEGVPYVIENVPGAPLHNPITLCGTRFGLHLIRHRLFESSLPLVAPSACGSHQGCITVFGHDSKAIVGGERIGYPLEVAQREMGIDWMRRDELLEAITPVYSSLYWRTAPHAIVTKCLHFCLTAEVLQHGAAHGGGETGHFAFAVLTHGAHA